MKAHVANYLKFLGYGEQDIVPSEISGSPSCDLHHVIWRSQGGSDEVENIIALTRQEHDRAHFKCEPYLTREELQKVHQRFMENHAALRF